MNSKHSIVVLPTYNEAQTLPALVDAIRMLPGEPHVLIVDDNSPDGTGDVADKIAAADRGVLVLHRPGKGGLGPAYRAGFAMALDAGYGVVAQMDADGSHRPQDLVELIAVAGDGRVAIGSRNISGGTTKDWAVWRKRVSGGGNAYVRLVSGIPVTDSTSGFRAWPAQALRDVHVEQVRSIGYAFQIEMAIRALRAGWDVVEVPIVFVERATGASKFNLGIVWEALWRSTGWGVKYRFGRSRNDRERHPQYS